MKFNVFAFSAPDFAPRRTLVRLAARNRVLQTILSLLILFSGGILSILSLAISQSY